MTKNSTTEITNTIPMTTRPMRILRGSCCTVGFVIGRSLAARPAAGQATTSCSAMFQGPEWDETNRLHCGHFHVTSDSYVRSHPGAGSVASWAGGPNPRSERKSHNDSSLSFFSAGKEQADATIRVLGTRARGGGARAV